jgi:hypothetical protein
VRPILSLTYTPASAHSDEVGTIHVRNLGRAPAFPLTIRIDGPRGGVHEFERFGVSVDGLTDLFGEPVKIGIYDGRYFTLTYGDIDGKKYKLKVRCDRQLIDRFAVISQS